MLIILEINLNEILVSYSRLTSITKIVKEIQGLNIDLFDYSMISDLENSRYRR